MRSIMTHVIAGLYYLAGGALMAAWFYLFAVLMLSL